MSNPLPIQQPPTQRGSAPNAIEPELYKGLADLRPHCSRDGVALIDRAYRDALALHKRVLDLEAELALYVEPAPSPGFGLRAPEMDNDGRDLL